jgi:hypothetical protein
MQTGVAEPNTIESYQVVAGKDEFRRDVFCLLLKRTYDILPGRPAVRAETARPLDLVDVYYDPGNPETCSVKFENDLAPFKTSTDVVVIGKVYALEGKPVLCLDAGVEVAGRRKLIRVMGDRQCIYRAGREPTFTNPLPFTTLEARYELAYGGTDTKSIPDMPLPYPRNHLGRGFAIRNSQDVIDGLPLPNFEDPQELLAPERIVVGEPEGWSRQPLPQGFGWFQRTWYPRCSFVGSVPGFIHPDTVLREELLGLVPKGQIALARKFKLPSFDVRFNNGASQGLVLPFLQGGEQVRLLHLTPERGLEFFLPSEPPRMMMNIGLGERELEPFLHTVCIRVEDRQVDLVWRGAHEFPGLDWLPEMRQLNVEVQ